MNNFAEMMELGGTSIFSQTAVCQEKLPVGWVNVPT